LLEDLGESRSALAHIRVMEGLKAQPGASQHGSNLPFEEFGGKLVWCI
jgi:hypothetical protein